MNTNTEPVTPLSTQQTKHLGTKKLTLQQMTAIALMAALMCVLGPMSLPIGPVPITLTNLIIYLAVYLLGTKQGTLSYLLYFFIGLIGLPVFSGFSGGVGKIVGPTGGFLVGFIFMALITGVFLTRFSGKLLFSILGMMIGTLLAYFCGTLWFAFSTNSSISYALSICVFPFLLGDLIKIGIAAYIGPLLYRVRSKTNFVR